MCKLYTHLRVAQENMRVRVRLLSVVKGWAYYKRTGQRIHEHYHERGKCKLLFSPIIIVPSMLQSLGHAENSAVVLQMHFLAKKILVQQLQMKVEPKML